MPKDKDFAKIVTIKSINGVKLPTCAEFIHWKLNEILKEIATEQLQDKFIAEGEAKGEIKGYAKGKIEGISVGIAVGVAASFTIIAEKEFSSTPENDWHTSEQRLKGYDIQEDIIESAKEKIKAQLENSND